MEQVTGQSGIVSQKTSPRDPWKILICDDEEQIHAVTRLVLADYQFDGRGIEFFSAYSAEETKSLLLEHPDVSLILLDVVMEEDDSGLKLIRYIRNELANKFIRIILRTGQPGQAPEKLVISEYDINDYKEKTELTAQKLYTTITAALRTYRDLKTIEKNRRGLEQIVSSSANIFELQSLSKFASGVLVQLTSMLGLDDHSVCIQASGFAISRFSDEFYILAGTGQFKSLVGQPIRQALPPEVLAHLLKALERKACLFEKDIYIGYFCTENASENLVYLQGQQDLTETDRNLIRIFSTNVAIAYDNMYLKKEIEDTQKEVLLKLGAIVEHRAHDVGYHVSRVSEYSHLLGLRYGLSSDEAELIRLSSTMHDLGKIGIPDSILHKPGKLTIEEFELMKNHTVIGYDILKNSNRKILKTAAIIALQHHEHWDGQGYPLGLAGEDIHLFGRITFIADVFDALSIQRVYKRAWTLDEILDYFREETGKKFDPKLVSILLTHLPEFLTIKDRYPD